MRVLGLNSKSCQRSVHLKETYFFPPRYHCLIARRILKRSPLSSLSPIKSRKPHNALFGQVNSARSRLVDNTSLDLAFSLVDLPFTSSKDSLSSHASESDQKVKAVLVHIILDSEHLASNQKLTLAVTSLLLFYASRLSSHGASDELRQPCNQIRPGTLRNANKFSQQKSEFRGKICIALGSLTLAVLGRAQHTSQILSPPYHQRKMYISHSVGG